MVIRQFGDLKMEIQNEWLAKARKRKEYSLTAESLRRGGNYNRKEREEREVRIRSMYGKISPLRLRHRYEMTIVV